MSLYIVWIASKDLKDGEPYAEQPLRTAHDEVHNAFMTPPPYTCMKEGEAPQLGNGPKLCRPGLCVRKCPQDILTAPIW